MEGYFTVSQNGLWGLIRADGTELLPCRAASPVSNCGNGNHWMWNVSGMSWEEIDAISAELEEAGEPVLCQGHGAGSTIFFYDLDAPGRDIHALDPGALRVYISSDGPGSIVPVTDELWEHYGDRLPAFTAHEEGEEGDPRYPGDPVVTENADGSLDRYMYISREGNFYFVPNAQMAGFFYNEQLAPVQMPGGWVYVGPRRSHCDRRFLRPHLRHRNAAVQRPARRRTLLRRSAAKRLCSRAPRRRLGPAGCRRNGSHPLRTGRRRLGGYDPLAERKRRLAAGQSCRFEFSLGLLPLSSGQNVKNLQKNFVKRPKNTCNAGPGVLYLPMAANGL